MPPNFFDKLAIVRRAHFQAALCSAKRRLANAGFRLKLAQANALYGAVQPDCLGELVECGERRNLFHVC